MQTPPERFTLKQVADSIRKTIESRYNRTYWVTAEMHKLNQTRKGHCYPELVQKENDQIVVEMRGTIWKSQFEHIQRRFMDIVKEPLRDGMELLFQVRIVYHPIYNLGLEILDIDPNYTLGALQRERQETLERLLKEGILNSNQQLKLAMLPKRLAVISQADSKGYSDFSMLLNGHSRKYHFHTFLFEATLQGDAAIPSITGQLERIRKVRDHFDAVVIIRGGGGEIGMHCYNNYTLSRAIATFPLPVLTGIGHSTNLTVCEMIAYNNGITPSDLAYYFLRIFEELDDPLDEIRLTLPGKVQRLLQLQNTIFGQLTREFQQLIRQSLTAHKTVLGSLSRDLGHGTRFALRDQHSRVTQSAGQLKNGGLQLCKSAGSHLNQQLATLSIYNRFRFETEQRQLETFTRELPVQVQTLLQQRMNTLNNAEKHTRLVDPMQVLKRGYAIVTNANGVLSESNPTTEGASVLVRTQTQEFAAKVERLHE